MGLEIFWSEFAKLKLEEIYHYYRLKAGKKVAKKIINEIFIILLILDKNPIMGQLESVLEDKYRKFRYLIYSNYKIIYYINTKSRQNPNK